MSQKCLEPVTALGGKLAPEELTKLDAAVNPQDKAFRWRRRGRPHRHHTELRSRDPVPPRQCVSDDHSNKRAPRPAWSIIKWHPGCNRASDQHETLMQFAFMRALPHWAEHHSNNPTMTIPTGRVDAAELARVVCALGKTKTQTGNRTSRSTSSAM